MKKTEESAAPLLLDPGKLPPHLRPPVRHVATRFPGSSASSSTPRATEWSDYIACFEGKEL